ncbi:MAG: iron-containing alcohol dehydrogenase, partial [Gammaproteobacteria bacterium]|nr:iron-containing alcohol dehydrogenase [Gammaproteobacteria bacterium]
MQTLNFHTTRSVLAEPGASSRLGDILRDLGCRRVALVTDPMILSLGLAEPAMRAIEQAGLHCWIWSQVVADPPESMILQAVAAARQEHIDGVLSIGGGSSMDTAKLLAVLLNSSQPLSEMYGIEQVEGERLPLVLAPTTAGTGSEVTPISIVTTGDTEKKGVVARQLLPDWAVLDAELTVGLPREVTAATGVDAMVHAIEAYTSRHKKNVLSDCLARQALALLGANIRRVCDRPDDRQARGNMLLGSMLAGMAFANSPVAAVHALAYPLGGHFHVPHGLSNALVLPYVLEYNMPCAAPLYAELAPVVFPDRASGSDPAQSLLDGFVQLAPDIGLKTRLREVGVGHNHLRMLAEDAMKQTRLLVNNPR